MSWVIVDKKTGKPVFETFNRSTADKVRKLCSVSYKVVPIGEWLGALNRNPEL